MGSLWSSALLFGKRLVLPEHEFQLETSNRRTHKQLIDATPSSARLSAFRSSVDFLFLSFRVRGINHNRVEYFSVVIGDWNTTATTATTGAILSLVAVCTGIRICTHTPSSKMEIFRPFDNLNMRLLSLIASTQHTIYPRPAHHACDQPVSGVVPPCEGGGGVHTGVMGSFVGCFLSVKCRYLQTPQSGIPPGTHTSHGPHQTTLVWDEAKHRYSNGSTHASLFFVFLRAQNSQTNNNERHTVFPRQK
ncbi:hypothetical protein FPQ18DRAFT_301459 [Pyronema domesticum]|nr:hypothetical protein FPQ18DRAFT_301459 [Pyronema domesticum]